MVNGILDDRRGEGGREGEGDRWADEKERERERREIREVYQPFHAAAA